MPSKHICRICFGWMLDFYPYHLEIKKCVTCGNMKDVGMISLKELLGKYDFKDLTPELQGNIMTLLERINKVREKYAKPMKVTSGYRSVEDHKRIYKEKGIEESKIPMKSQHLKCLAVDILDVDGKLNKWCKENEDFLIKVGLYMEERQGNWQHFQCEAPKSGKRWFNP